MWNILGNKIYVMYLTGCFVVSITISGTAIAQLPKSSNNNFPDLIRVPPDFGNSFLLPKNTVKPKASVNNFPDLTPIPPDIDDISPDVLLKLLEWEKKFGYETGMNYMTVLRMKWSESETALAAPSGALVCRIDAVYNALSTTNWPQIPSLAQPDLQTIDGTSLESLRKLNSDTNISLGILMSLFENVGVGLARLENMKCAAESLINRLDVLVTEIEGNKPWPETGYTESSSSTPESYNRFAWAWYNDYFRLAFGIKLAETSNMPGKIHWLTFGKTDVCDRTTEQASIIAKYRSDYDKCWEEHESNVKGGGFLPSELQCAHVSFLPSAGLCMSIDGRGTGCADDPDASKAPYYSLPRKDVERQFELKAVTLSTTRLLKKRVTEIQNIIPSIKAKGQIEYQEMGSLFDRFNSIQLSLLLREEKGLMDANEVLKPELVALENIRNVLEGMRAEHVRLETAMAKKLSEIENMQRKVQQEDELIRQNSLLAISQVEAAEEASNAVQSSNIHDATTYKSMAASDSSYNLFQNSLNKLHRDGVAFAASLSKLVTLKAELLKLSIDKATFQLRIEIQQAEWSQRNMKAELEKRRLIELSAAHAIDVDNLRLLTTRLTDSKSLQVGVCTGTPNLTKTM